MMNVLYTIVEREPHPLAATKTYRAPHFLPIPVNSYCFRLLGTNKAIWVWAVRQYMFLIRPQVTAA